MPKLKIIPLFCDNSEKHCSHRMEGIPVSCHRIQHTQNHTQIISHLIRSQFWNFSYVAILISWPQVSPLIYSWLTFPSLFPSLFSFFFTCHTPWHFPLYSWHMSCFEGPNLVSYLFSPWLHTLYLKKIKMQWKSL